MPFTNAGPPLYATFTKYWVEIFNTASGNPWTITEFIDGTSKILEIHKSRMVGGNKGSVGVCDGCNLLSHLFTMMAHLIVIDP